MRLDSKPVCGIFIVEMNYKPIKTDFVWTGDGYGAASARRIRQIKRVGDIAIYERTVAKSGRPDGYEVIKISRHEGYELGGQKIEPAETYPGASQFGKSAWSTNTLQRAEQIFAEKLAEAKENEAKEAAAKAAGIVLKKRGRPRKVK